MDKDDISKLISLSGEKPNEPTQLGNLGTVIKQMQNLTGYFKHLENGIISMSHELQAQGLGLQMFMRILIDKGICTEEEIKRYHTKYVGEPMKAAAEAMQAKMEAAEKEMKKQANEKKIIQPVTSTDDVADTEDSKVVLASEKGKVVRFPDGNKDS